MARHRYQIIDHSTLTAMSNALESWGQPTNYGALQAEKVHDSEDEHIRHSRPKIHKSWATPFRPPSLPPSLPPPLAHGSAERQFTISLRWPLLTPARPLPLRHVACTVLARSVGRSLALKKMGSRCWPEWSGAGERAG